MVAVPVGTIHGVLGTPGAFGVFGQCRLTLSNSSSLLLKPYNGNLIVINGRTVQVPDAGVSLTSTGAVASTLYNVYATESSQGVVGSLFISTGAYAVSTIQGMQGVPNLNGASSYALVGMARATASTLWADTATQRFVATYYGRQGKYGNNGFTANRVALTATASEINPEIRVEFLTWGDESVRVTINAIVVPSTVALADVRTFISFDGAAAEDAVSYGQAAATNQTAIASTVSIEKIITEGYHYATLFGATNGSSATWLGAAANGIRTTLWMGTRG